MSMSPKEALKEIKNLFAKDLPDVTPEAPSTPETTDDDAKEDNAVVEAIKNLMTEITALKTSIDSLLNTEKTEAPEDVNMEKEIPVEAPVTPEITDEKSEKIKSLETEVENLRIELSKTPSTEPVMFNKTSVSSKKEDTFSNRFSFIQQNKKTKNKV